MPPFLRPVIETEFEALQERLKAMSLFTAEFAVLLAGSTLIATFGLFQNSPAVIIGAMIIAPLMRPLLGLSLATLTGDSSLLGRAVFTLLSGTLIGIFISAGMAVVFRSLELTPEIISRTHPTLLDLGVAIVAGAVGAYCQTDTKLSDSLAGVAIAVALVPPLSVVGIGIAFNSLSVWSGAALLYATNLIGITVAGSLVFLLMGFISLHQARKGLIVSGAASILLVVPLGLSMRELILENQITTKIKTTLKDRTFTFKGVQLRDVQVQRFKEPMIVVATVLSPQQPINSRQVRLVQDFLVNEFHVPITFKLNIIPAMEVSAEISALDEQSTDEKTMQNSSIPTNITDTVPALKQYQPQEIEVPSSLQKDSQLEVPKENNVPAEQSPLPPDPPTKGETSPPSKP